MKKTKKTKITHRLAAAATVGMMMSQSTLGFAAVDANSLVTNLVKSSKGFTDLINVLGYVGGSGLAVAGIFKLKQHVDAPSNVPMKDGVMRLAAGGALLTLPFITSVMQGSVGEGDASVLTAQKVGQFQ